MMPHQVGYFYPSMHGQPFVPGLLDTRTGRTQNGPAMMHFGSLTQQHFMYPQAYYSQGFPPTPFFPNNKKEKPQIRLNKQRKNRPDCVDLTEENDENVRDEAQKETIDYSIFKLPGKPCNTEQTQELLNETCKNIASKPEQLEKLKESQAVYLRRNKTKKPKLEGVSKKFSKLNDIERKRKTKTVFSQQAIVEDISTAPPSVKKFRILTELESHVSSGLTIQETIDKAPLASQLPTKASFEIEKIKPPEGNLQETPKRKVQAPKKTSEKLAAICPQKGKKKKIRIKKDLEESNQDLSKSDQHHKQKPCNPIQNFADSWKGLINEGQLKKAVQNACSKKQSTIEKKLALKGSEMEVLWEKKAQKKDNDPKRNEIMNNQAPNKAQPKSLKKEQVQTISVENVIVTSKESEYLEPDCLVKKEVSKQLKQKVFTQKCASKKTKLNCFPKWKDAKEIVEVRNVQEEKLNRNATKKESQNIIDVSPSNNLPQTASVKGQARVEQKQGLGVANNNISRNLLSARTNPEEQKKQASEVNKKDQLKKGQKCKAVNREQTDCKKSSKKKDSKIKLIAKNKAKQGMVKASLKEKPFERQLKIAAKEPKLSFGFPSKLNQMIEEKIRAYFAEHPSILLRCKVCLVQLRNHEEEIKDHLLKHLQQRKVQDKEQELGEFLKEQETELIKLIFVCFNFGQNPLKEIASSSAGPDKFLQMVTDLHTRITRPNIRCQSCNFLIDCSQKENLEKHVYVHYIAPLYKCLVCGQKWRDISTHCRKQHGGVQRFEDLRKNYEKGLIRILDNCYLPQTKEKHAAEDLNKIKSFLSTEKNGRINPQLPPIIDHSPKTFKSAEKTLRILEPSKRTVWRPPKSVSSSRAPFQKKIEEQRPTGPVKNEKSLQIDDVVSEKKSQSFKFLKIVTKTTKKTPIFKLIKKKQRLGQPRKVKPIPSRDQKQLNPPENRFNSEEKAAERTRKSEERSISPSKSSNDNVPLNTTNKEEQTLLSLKKVGTDANKVSQLSEQNGKLALWEQALKEVRNVDTKSRRCALCARYVQLPQIENHVIAMHLRKCLFQCLICGTELLTEIRLKAHVRREHRKKTYIASEVLDERERYFETFLELLFQSFPLRTGKTTKFPHILEEILPNLRTQTVHHVNNAQPLLKESLFQTPKETKEIAISRLPKCAKQKMEEAGRVPTKSQGSPLTRDEERIVRELIQFILLSKE